MVWSVLYRGLLAKLFLRLAVPVKVPVITCVALGAKSIFVFAVIGPLSFLYFFDSNELRSNPARRK